MLHPRYHPKIIGHLKNEEKNKCVYTINHNEKKMKVKNRLHKYDIIDLGLDMGTNMINIRSVSV